MTFFRLLAAVFLTTVSSLVFCFPHAQASATETPQSSSSNSSYDGSAELPRLIVHSSVADTPAPGQVHTLREGDSLQSAIDGARCGDTLQLQAGATFRGQFSFPEKACDDAHWIVVRTAAAEKELPPEGTRLTPCFAGVASLPGRPEFHCGAVRNVLAKIEYDKNNGSGPLAFLPGANHYRFVGLEVTRGMPGAPVTALGFVKGDGTADHLVFDRVWFHGTAQDETSRGLALVNTTAVAVVDSFFNDFHCIARTGSCTDAQALGSSGGNNPGGPYKIENNFLEASGENILFGGGGASRTPADIEIRRNYLFKPMIWKLGEPGFVGGVSGSPFIVKNHFELKNAQRVLFEGNVLENTWGGFSQAGFSILLTPKNQNNHCPACRVTDITIRYNKIKNVGGVFQIGNVASDAGGISSEGRRYSIHDLLVENVHFQDFGGFGLFAMILSVAPPLEDVRIEHVTAFVPRALFSIGNVGEKIPNFTIANNIFSSAGPREIASAGGGPRSCAYQPELQGPAGVLKNCFQNSSFTHNLIVGGSGWPSGNITPKDMHAAGIRAVHSPETGAYELCRQKEDNSGCKKTSPAIGAATDGRNIGADLEGLSKAIAGVS